MTPMTSSQDLKYGLSSDERIQSVGKARRKWRSQEGSAEHIYVFIQASRPDLALLNDRKVLLWTESPGRRRAAILTAVEWGPSPVDAAQTRGTEHVNLNQ